MSTSKDSLTVVSNHLDKSIIILLILKPFPFYKQPDQMDCGPTCLRMIAKHYGKNFSLQRLREIAGIKRKEVLLWGISDAAEKIAFRSLGRRISINQLTKLELPAILHWHQKVHVFRLQVKLLSYQDNLAK
ncbi:MAG: hypothetical protein EOO43_19825 [Flavobacterium sp.]|nr:MAG: hypothetical protein EOO43_19825 [Flavobacterium sp.]